MLPWKETSAESERMRFIELRAAGAGSIAELCRWFGISRKTAYKLIGRYEAYGPDGLRDRSRAPHRHANATPTDVAERIVRAKRAHPSWGPKKLVAWLRSGEPDVAWPAPSTASGILDRAGLVKRRKRRHRSSPWDEPFAHARQPNDVWSIDFKGWFRTGDGTRIDPLTTQDAASRYLLVCEGLERPAGPEARRALERAFREYGLPRVIRTDNGPPFASAGLGSLSPLAIWWVKLGILPERIEPGRPEQNERLHRTLKAETASPPMANRKRQRRAFDRFRATTSSVRTKRWGKLALVPPLSLPRQTPGGTGVNRRVRGNGAWKGNRLCERGSEPIGPFSRRNTYGPYSSSSACSDTARRVGDPRKSVTYATHVPGRSRPSHRRPRQKPQPIAQSFRRKPEPANRSFRRRPEPRGSAGPPNTRWAT